MGHQKGMSLLNALLLVMVIVTGGILGMKIIPVYLQYATVKSSVTALSRLHQSELSVNPKMNESFLSDRLKRQLYINEVDDVVNKGFKIHSKGPYDYLVNIDYEVKRHLFYNVGLYFTFKDTIEVHIGQD